MHILPVSNLFFVVAGTSRWTDLFVVTVSDATCSGNDNEGGDPSVMLATGEYPLFAHLPSDGTSVDFNDVTTSLRCQFI